MCKRLEGKHEASTESALCISINYLYATSEMHACIIIR